MSKEDKDLLIKYLCSALPYKVMVEIRSIDKEDLRPWFGPLSFKDLECFYLGVGYSSIKPYLRQMSNMTEKEKEEYCDLQDKFLYSNEYPVTNAYKLFEWLNERHFDYMNLIKRNLAVEIIKDTDSESVDKLSEFIGTQIQIKYNKFIIYGILKSYKFINPSDIEIELDNCHRRYDTGRVEDHVSKFTISIATLNNINIYK